MTLFKAKTHFRGLAVFLVCLLVFAGHAWAAAAGHAAAGNGSTGSGKAEATLILAVLSLLIVGRLLGEVMHRLGQPALMGQLLAGIVLGPSLFGWVWPAAHHFVFPDTPAQKGMLDGLSQIGILMLLLLTGMETDLKLVRKSGFAAVAIALSGIALPFFCGYMLGQFLPAEMLPPGASRLVPSLFLGTALSISSIKIVAMVVREMNFMRRNLGQVIVATAIMEDTVGWVIIAITFGIAGADSGNGAQSVNWLEVGKTVAGIALFLLFCFTTGRWLVFSAIRWVNDNFRSEFPVITAILVIMGLMALVTHLLGVRTVLGAFMAGVLIGESPILTGHIQQQLRGMITAFFMPVFFGMSGLAADLTILKDPRIAALTVGLVVVASVGKFSGAFVGAMLGRLRWREGIALGCAMNARGSTEVIVASIGLSMGALTQNLYTMIVTMAVLTTMAMPPMLRAALADLPMNDDEKKRVEREQLDEKGFVPNLERLLLAVDTSPVGLFGARLAGLLAGAHGMPVTMLKLENDLRLDNERAAKKSEPAPQHSSAEAQAAKTVDARPKDVTGAQSIQESAAEQRADPVARAVKTGAKASAEKMFKDDAEPDPDKVHLTTRVPLDRLSNVVRDEARKGYDLLFIGLEHARDADGNIAPEISEVAEGFEGPMMLLTQPVDVPVPHLTRYSRILLPVNGSHASRRASEICFALARASGAHVEALYVTQGEAYGARTLRHEESVLKDAAELAQRYDVQLTTRISKRGAAAPAILAEARRGPAMVVMGVSARPGEQLFFGNTASAILKETRQSVLLVAS